MTWDSILAGVNPEDELMASLLVIPDAYARAKAMGLRPEHLARKIDQWLVKVIDEAQADGQTEIGIITAAVAAKGKEAFDRFSKFTDAAPTPGLLETVVGLVRSAWLKRQVKSLATGWSLEAERAVDGMELLTKAQGELRHLLAGTVTSELARPDLDPVRKEIADSLAGIPKESAVPTGLPSLDMIFGGGLTPEQVYVLAGRPGTGKTMLGIQIAEYAANCGLRVAYFSLEMSKRELTYRRICARARLPLPLIYSPSDTDYEKISRAIDEIGDTELLIDDTPRITVGQIESRCRVAHDHAKLHLVVIDYFGLISKERRGRSEVEELGEISRAIKSDIARGLKVPVILSTQLNRNLEHRGEGSCPKLSDLRGSGDIEQDADAVVFLWHPHESHDARSHVAMSVAKNRHGPTGRVELQANYALQNFKEGNDGCNECNTQGQANNPRTSRNWQN